jgi:hypothetical protein
MSMKKPLGISLLVGLMALALAALPAFASAANVTLRSGSKTGPALANGTVLTADSSSTSNLVFTSASGNIECKENTLNGEVENNGTATTGIKITSASFLAAGGGKDCLTTIPNGSGGTLTATITAENLPYTADLPSSGAGTLTGSGTPASVKFKAIFDNGTTPVLTCTFEKTSVATTFNFNTALKIDVGASQVFTGTGTGCPTSGTLTGSFLVTIKSSGGAVFATTP